MISVVSSRSEQKLRTRRLIIEAALQEFARAGLLAARTADVALAAGLSHGALFVHFPTRVDLLIAVLDEFGTGVAQRVHELAREGHGIRCVLKAHLRGLAEREPFYTRLVMESHLLPPAARSVLTAIQSAISFHLARAAEREMAAGRLRQVPLHLLFNTWLGLLHHYLINRDLFAPGRSVIAGHGSELIEHFMALLEP